MTDTSGLKFDAVTRFIVSASGLHGAEYNREYERVYKIVANFALQQANEHHATATAAMKIIESEREAAVAKLVEALERRLKTEESQAAMRAIASGLGVSEWPAFVSESFFDDCAALAEWRK